tara:strand:+ start:3482 stop:4150 length:669 start_codon:yes stop_codon:yes gene_type:complete
MKTIQDFLEKTDFSYLNVNNSFEKIDYQKIWEDVYLPSQQKKVIENNLNEEAKNKAFNGLSKRGYFLCQILDFFDCKNIAEVGTAEGFQFYTFCHHLKERGTVYTCDIRDVRNKNYIEKYSNGKFTLGTSKEMANNIINDKKSIDLFWIDGAHHNTAVLTDVIRLSKTQSSNPIWVFDDFNERFGAFGELQFLSKLETSYTISLGPTASGKPNTTLIVQGRF